MSPGSIAFCGGALYTRWSLCFGRLQVRLAIAEKGLLCEEYDVSLPLSEHNEPWFMRLNPAGEVPVLVHGDEVICDPSQIMDYLEHNFKDDGGDGHADRDALTRIAYKEPHTLTHTHVHTHTHSYTHTHHTHGTHTHNLMNRYAADSGPIKEHQMCTSGLETAVIF